MQDPNKRKQLYSFLKDNDLVKTDFETFSAKYTTEESTSQLYAFLQDNKLTTKNQSDFYNDYFGDLKKKEDSTPQNTELATEQEGTISGSDLLKNESNKKEPAKEINYPTAAEIKKQTGWNDEQLKENQERFKNTPKGTLRDSNTVFEKENYTQQDRTGLDFDNKAERVDIDGFDNEKMNNLTVKFKEQAILSEDEIRNIDADIDRKKRGDFTFGEKLKMQVKKRASLIGDVFGFKSEKDLKTISKDDRDEIIKKRIQEKQEEFIENLPEEDKKTFQSYLPKRDKELSKKYKEAEFINTHIEKFVLPKEMKSLKGIDNEIKELADKPKEQITKEDEENYNTLIKQRKERVNVIKGIQNQYKINRKTQIDSTDDLLTFEDEIDLVKRDYGFWRNYISPIAEGFLNLAIDSSLFAGNLINEAVINNAGEEDFLVDIRNKIQEYSKLQAEAKENFGNTIKKRKTVEDIDSVGDFAEYTGRLVSEQISVLGTIYATGGLGLGITASSSGGDRLGQLQLERERGENNYTNAQINGNALMYASGEYIGEKITLGILNDYKKVFKSINASKTLKNSFKENLKQFSNNLVKGVSTANKEGLSEVYTELIQWSGDKLIGEDRKIEFLETYVSGFVIGKGIHVTSGITNWAVGQYSKSENRKKVKENTLKILESQKIIDEGNLSDEVKSLYQEKIQTLTNENNSLINESVKDIQKLNPKQVTEVTKINNKIRAIQVTLQKGNVSENIKKSLLSEIKSLHEQKQEILSLNTNNKKTIEENSEPKTPIKETVNEQTEKTAEKTEKPKVETTTPKTEVESEKEVEQKTEIPKELHAKPQETTTSKSSKIVSSNTKTALENNKGKIESVTDENGNESFKDVEFTKDDADAELDRLEILAEKGKLTLEEFQKSFFGQNTDTATLPDVKKEIETNPIQFISDLKNNFNETQTKGDTSTDKNIQSGTTINQQQGKSENIQPTINNTTSKKPIEVKSTVKRVKSVKNSEYDVTIKSDGNVSKVTSVKDGREISKFREVTDKKTGKKKIQRNANYSKIVADATGTKTENQLKTERKELVKKSLKEYSPSDSFGFALDYLAKGGKVSLQSARKETGLSQKEVKWAVGFTKETELPSIENVAEKIVSESNQNLDEQEVRNALIDIITSNSSKSELEDIIVNQIKEQNSSQKEQELYQYLNALSEEKRSLVESIIAEDDYLSELSYDEKIQYYEEQYQAPEEKTNREPESSNTSVQESRGKEYKILNRRSQKELGSSDRGLEQYRSFQDRLGSRKREAEKERKKPLTLHEQEDLEKFEALKFAKENNLWIKDFYSLGNATIEGGHEHRLVLDESKSIVYKSNNLANSRNLISNLFESVDIGNGLFPETEYEFVGFTGIDNGVNRTPHIEVVFKQKYYPNTTQAEPGEIKTYMESIGFEQRTPESFYNGEYLVYDLHPRNVLKDKNGIIYIVDAEFKKVSESKPTEGKIDDDIQAQGITLSKENNRDSALSDEGAVKQKNARQRKFKRFWNNTFSSKRGLDNKVVRVIEDLFGNLSAINESLQYEASQFAKISKQIKQKYAKDYNSKLKSINDYLSGDTNVDLSFLTDEQRNNLDAFRGRVDNLSDKIINKLKDRKKRLKNDEAISRVDALIETIENNKGNYLFRQYDAFSNPDYIEALTSKYPNVSAKRRLNNAIDFVANEQGISREEAKTQILTYLDNLKDSGSYVGASTSGKAKAPFLKKRKDIPQEIRELLGESKDPVKNYIATVHNMSNYIANLEYQSKMAETLEDLGLVSDTMKEGYTRLVKSTEGWDLLQDIYVPNEVAEGIKDLQPLDSVKEPFMRFLVRLSSFTKVGKTVLSPITMSRNFLSGVFLSLNNGVNPMFNPKLFIQGIAHSWGTKKTNTQLRSENQRLIKLGIIKDGAVSREVLGILNDAKLPIDQILSKNILNKFLDVMQKLYAMGDDAYKVVGFYVWEGRYKKAGYTQQQAEDMAVDRVRNGFPTYSKIPKNIQKLRRIPFVGTFPSFTYEVFRTNFNNIKFIGQDLKTAFNKGVSKEKRRGHAKMAYHQISGMAVATATAFALSELSKSLFGISDEEDETTRNMSSPWQKDSKNIYVGKMGNNYEVVDATAFFPQETILKPLRILTEQREGRNIDDKIVLSALSAANAFFSTDIFIKTVEELHMNKNGYGTEIYAGKNLIEGISNNPEKITNYILKQAGPGIYNNIGEFARANNIAPEFFGEKETSYKEYTNTEALMALVGIRLSRINYANGIKSIGFDAKDEYQDARKNVLSIVKSSRKLNEEDIKIAFDDYKANNIEVHKKILLAVNGAKKQGMNPETIKKTLKGAGYSNADIKAIQKGRTPELKEISKTSLNNKINSIEIGRFSNDKKKVDSEIKNVRDKAKFLNDLIKKYNRNKKAVNTKKY